MPDSEGQGMRWFGHSLTALVAVAVAVGGYWLHVTSEPHAMERTVELCKAQFVDEFPRVRARNWQSEVFDDFAKVYADTPSLGFDYGCHLRRTGLAWAVEPDSGVLVDGQGKVLYRPPDLEPLQPGESNLPNCICVDGSSDC